MGDPGTVKCPGRGVQLDGRDGGRLCDRATTCSRRSSCARTAKVPAASKEALARRATSGQSWYLSLHGHSDEELDGCFNFTGDRLVTASTDCTAMVCVSALRGGV